MAGHKNKKTSTSDLENANNVSDLESDEDKMENKEVKVNLDSSVEKESDVSGIQSLPETDLTAESSMNLRNKDNTVIVIIVSSKLSAHANSQTSKSEALSDDQKITSAHVQDSSIVDSVSEQLSSNIDKHGKNSDSDTHKVLTLDESDLKDQKILTQDKASSTSKSDELLPSNTGGRLTSSKTLLAGNEAKLENSTNEKFVKKPLISKPPLPENKFSEFMDNTDESTDLQFIPLKSPWGPPHGEYSSLNSLNFDNPHKNLQANIGTDSCCCCCCVFKTRFDVKDEKESAKADRPVKMKQDETERPCCSCNCISPHLSGRTPCFIYPVFPMYCFQPMECGSSNNGCKVSGGEHKFLPHNGGCKHIKEEEQRFPLCGSVFPLLSANFNYCNKLKSNTRACVDESRYSSSNCQNVIIRPAGLENNNTNSYTRSPDSLSHLSGLKDIDLNRAKSHVMRRPPSVICYICGREYGTASIRIHEKQCLEMWRKINSQLPKAKRRPEPGKPSLLGQTDSEVLKISGKPDYDFNSLNEAAFEAFQQQYVKCEKCGRSFLLESLQLHSKVCRGYHSIVKR